MLSYDKYLYNKDLFLGNISSVMQQICLKHHQKGISTDLLIDFGCIKILAEMAE